MFLRLVALVVGLLELAAPHALVDVWMSLATTDESNTELRSWVYTAARVEGALLVVWALRSRGSVERPDD
ncbi:MAG: hypothetical protein V5A31_09250 [Haloferacaceae archaeon]